MKEARGATTPSASRGSAGSPGPSQGARAQSGGGQEGGSVPPHGKAVKGPLLRLSTPSSTCQAEAEPREALRPWTPARGDTVCSEPRGDSWLRSRQWLWESRLGAPLPGGSGRPGALPQDGRSVKPPCPLGGQPLTHHLPHAPPAPLPWARPARRGPGSEPGAPCSDCSSWNSSRTPTSGGSSALWLLLATKTPSPRQVGNEASLWGPASPSGSPWQREHQQLHALPEGPAPTSRKQGSLHHPPSRS